jgi:hypothetical protein
MSERLQTSLAELKEDFEQRQSNSQKKETIQIREHLEARLAVLREAFAQGEANFQNLETQKAQQRDDLLRIDGAMGIIIETLQVLEDKEKTQVVNTEQVAPPGA